MDAIYQIAQIEQVVKALWNEGKSKKVWAFHAPMGAGKTTTIHALCKLLGVLANTSSPTYAIINEYKSAVVGTIYHMDWYRLKDEEDAINVGVEDALQTGNICLIEWPDRALELLPDNCFHITIEVLDATTRRVFTTTP